MIANFYRYLLLFCLFLTLSFPVFSSSAMGGSIHYVCKGNGKYDVYITAVIDCGGVGISQTNLVAKCSTATVTVSNQTKLSTKDITGIDPKCPLGSKCNGTFQYGFEETIWKMELDLSSYGSSYCDWILSATRCCRSGNLVTGGANTDFMITANLNKCLSSCNSSPYFSAETKNILCYNQDMILNMGVIDTVDSGDSISYDLVAPMDANGGSVLGGNFTPNRPLSFFGFPNFNLQWPAGFRLDPLTGDLLFRPTQLNQVAVIVVEAKEWRKVNGTMTVIGRIRKEFTVFVVACGSKQVRIQPPYSKQACAGEQTCITISTSDDDASDSTRLTLSQGNLNMSFSHNSGTVQYASGQLCWTPDSSKISNIPYVVYVTAYDDNCPLSTTTTRAFSFFVREKPKGALHTEVLDCGRIALDFSLYNQVAGFQFRYSIQDTGRVERWAGSNGIDTARVPPGKYFVQLRLQSNTPCFTYYEDTVEIADYVQLAPLSDSSVCYGGSLTLEGKFSGGKAPYSFEWSSGGSTPQSLSVSNPETFTFYYDSVLFLSVTDSMGCAVNDSLFIKVNPLPQLDLGQDLAVCEGDSILVDAGGDTLGWSYLWKDGSNAQTRHSFADPSLWVQVTDSFGCVNSDTMSIWTNAVDVVGARSTSICLGDTILIEAQNAGSYFWYDRLSYQGDGSDIPLFTGSQLKFPLTASLHLILEGRSSLLNATCFDLDTLSLLTLPLPQVDLGGDQTICQGDSVVLSAPQATGNTYTWNIGQSGPDIVVSSNGMYQVSVQNIHGCTASDKMWLDVVEVPIDAGTDQQVCKNDTLYLYAGGVDSVRWYDAGTFNPGGTNSPAFVGDTFVYLATQSFTWLAEGYVTSKGLTCTWLDTVHADVYPQNFVQDINGTVNPDSVNVYTYSVDNTGQSSFQWTVQNGTLLNGQGTSSIEVVWTHPGNGEVHVVATSPDGCTSETNKLVMVVPTSLTNPRLPQFKAYPNPAHHQLTLEFEKEMKGANVRLMDARGRICLETQVNGDQLVLDIEALSRGIYLIQVEGYGQRLQVLE